MIGVTAPAWAASDVTLGSVTLPGWVWAIVLGVAAWSLRLMYSNIIDRIDKLSESIHKLNEITGKHGRSIAMLNERTRE